jgi:hypothetical protein
LAGSIAAVTPPEIAPEAAAIPSSAPKLALAARVPPLDMTNRSSALSEIRNPWEIPRLATARSAGIPPRAAIEPAAPMPAVRVWTATMMRSRVTSSRL